MSYCITKLLIFLCLIFQFTSLAQTQKNDALKSEVSVDVNENIVDNSIGLILDKEMSSKFGFPTANDLKLYVYPDPETPNTRYEIKLGDIRSLKQSGLIRGVKITIVTHGFMANLSNGPIDIKNAYLDKNFKNIVLLDWSKLSTPTPNIMPFSFLYYFQAQKNVVTTGKFLAQYIQFMKENSYAESYDDFHLVGHSLGAHVMGVAGSTIQKSTGQKIGRVSGLDPAGPFYSGVSKRFKFSKDDARFVDAIHTDTDGFGTPKSVATVDFYANGGLGDKQPKCNGKILVDLIFCAHMEAITYYINSIEGKKYYGCKCRKAIDLIINQPCEKPKKCLDSVLFGEFSSETIKGNYYLTIKS